MLAEILQYIREASGFGVLAVLFAAAFLEYMLPFVPGDSIVLAGSLVVVAGRWPFWVVYLTVVFGGFFGSAVHYTIGHALARPDGTVRGIGTIERLLGKGAMDRFFTAFQKHGLWVIAVNRALPGVRAACFIAAGAARVPPGHALAAGLLSNLVWSAGLLVLGVSLGSNLDNIQAALGVYQWAAAGLVIAVVLVWLGVRRARRRKRSE